MRLEQLAHFLAVLERGSVREAARQSGVTQPALSKSVRLLESELGVQLFVRSRHGVVPTPPGLTLAVRARAIQAEVRKVREEVAPGYQPGAVKVAFGLGQASMALIMSDAIAVFRKRWPEAHIRVMEGLPDTLLPLVRDETLDFVLGGRVEGAGENIAFKPLFRSARMVVGRRNHPLAGARSLTDLRDAEWIRTPPLEAVNGPLEQVFAAAGMPVPVTKIQCDSYHSATFLLANSDRLALMSRRQLDTPSGVKHLQAIPVREALPAFTVGMYTRADVPLTPAASTLARAVITVARKLSSSREA